MMITQILEKATSGQKLSRLDAKQLLNITNGSHDFYQLIETANRMSRKQFQNKAYIFSQIGLNAEPCQ